MDIQQLEKEAWNLRLHLNRRYTCEMRVIYRQAIKLKLLRLIKLSNRRWLRRHSKLFNIDPVLLLPALPPESKSLPGQEAPLWGKS